MKNSQSVLRGRILGKFDHADNQWRLRWCYINLEGTIKVWQLDTLFPTIVECFSYGKNLVLKHLSEEGRSETADQIDWWLKGDESYYCPHCLQVLDRQGTANEGTASEVLQFACRQCHSEVHIPADAFLFDQE